MIAGSGTKRRTVAKARRARGTVWHTLWVPVRTFAALVLVALVAGLVVTSAPAQSTSKASATAAVITGDLGRVARVRASGDDSASSSVTSDTPDGIVLGDGFVSVATSTSSLSAEATAEADDLELFGGLVTASIVQRKAVTTGGSVKYSGIVRGLVVRRRGGRRGQGHQDLPVPAGHRDRQQGRRRADRRAHVRRGRHPRRDAGRGGRRVREGFRRRRFGDAGADRPTATPTATPDTTPEPTATPEAARKQPDVRGSG